MAGIGRAAFHFDLASFVVVTLYVACGVYLLARYVVLVRAFGDGKRELSFGEGSYALRGADGTALFAADGGSVPAHVLGRRLELAYSILSAASSPDRARAGTASTPAPASGTGPAPTVAEVAARCGFTSAAYFSHAFRRHFGHRAGDLRRDATDPNR